MDVHRGFCEIAIHEDGKTRSVGQVKTAPEAPTLLAASLGPDDQVAIETTGNARILEPHVGGVLIVDTRNLRAITHAKLKNDRVDARRLAELLAAEMLPGAWRATRPRAFADAR